MATFVLIHGAGDDSWYWHLVVPELRARGHEVVAVDLPCEDDSAGLPEYADAVVEAIGDRNDLVLVAQSMAGFTAPLVCERVPVDLMVLLAAMIPAPGESPGDWWDNTGWEQARREQNQRDGRDPDAEIDVIADFLHDVPPDVVADAMARGERSQSGTPFEKPWPPAGRTPVGRRARTAAAPAPLVGGRRRTDRRRRGCRRLGGRGLDAVRRGRLERRGPHRRARRQPRTRHRSIVDHHPAAGHRGRDTRRSRRHQLVRRTRARARVPRAGTGRVGGRGRLPGPPARGLRRGCRGAARGRGAAEGPGHGRSRG